MSLAIVKQYYDSFNARDFEGMLALLSPDVRHEPNQGKVRIGLDLFTEFLQKMDWAYEEKLSDFCFYKAENQPNRIAVEFIVQGIYKAAEPGMPEAKGQPYTLPASAFLEVSEGKICRVATFYNLEHWLELVS